MTKYGRRLRFGFAPAASAADPARPLRLAQLAETLGLDYVGIMDAPHAASSPASHRVASREHQYEPWTLAAAIAMATSRITVFAGLSNLSLYPLALLAKAAASLDLLTGGRVELALVAGQQGGEQGSGEQGGSEEALAQIEEATQVMRLLWSGESSPRFTGNFFPLSGAQSGLAPAHRIGVWLHTPAPEALTLAWGLADGWLLSLEGMVQPGRDLATVSGPLDSAVAAAGREPAEMQRILTFNGMLTNAVGNGERPKGFQGDFYGSAVQWAEGLAEFAVTAGIDTFLLMEGEDAEAQLQMFGEEVVPLTREMAESNAHDASGLTRAYQGAGASGATPAEEETGEVDWVDETSMESFPASDPPASTSSV